MRQEEDSGILHNATELRTAEGSFHYWLQFDVKSLKILSA
jgi:hypothetical protein